MANDLTVQMAALDGFRRLYGTKARPEDMPRAWAAIVAEVRDELEAAMDDLDRQECPVCGEDLACACGADDRDPHYSEEEN